MISGLIYAMPCIVFACLPFVSFLHFSAMRFASLYRRERPTSASYRKDSPSRELDENGDSERRTKDDEDKEEE